MPTKKSETLRREETPSGEHTSEVTAYAANQRSTQAINSQDTVLLGTAMVQFLDSSGHTMTVRALIDPGSEKSFISEKVLTCLKPQVNKVRVEVTGVGAAVTSIAHKETTLTLRSIVDQSFSSHLSVYVLDKLTQLLPRKEVNASTWPHIKGLILADPRFYKAEPIDCLLGVDIYTIIMQPGLVKGGPDAPLAQNTVFGWILVGRASSCVSAHSSVQVFHTYTDQSVNTTLPKFWEIEEVPNDKLFTQDEEYCEEYFSTTTTWNSDGRYVIRLPLKQNRSYEGSREIAIACLLRQEKRRGRDLKLDHMYKEYIREYIRLRHMELVPPEELSRDNYYVPHHAVPRHGSLGEIRLVFNASQRDKGGISLNDNMYTGPKFQIDIATTLIRWKFYKYVFSSDIIKMFRHILVHPEDNNWQRIVWREDPSTPIRDYRLTIVMQGTAAAPFLAIRILQQLAQDREATRPEAAKLLRLQVYEVYVFGGADDLKSIIELRDQLIDLLKSAGMTLGKWSANDAAILHDVIDSKIKEIVIGAEEIISTLGIKWLPLQDRSTLRFLQSQRDDITTKRCILSSTAKLFDPLGWIAPVITIPKVIM